MDGIVIGTVWKTRHGCHLLVHRGVWHPLRGCWLEGCCSSLQTSPRVWLLTTPSTCPLKNRTLTSFPQLHTALLQVSTQRPWTSHCNNKKQIIIKQCKDTLQALANTRGIFKACLPPACSLSLSCMLVLGNQDRKGLQGHGVQSPATCPFRGF